MTRDPDSYQIIFISIVLVKTTRRILVEEFPILKSEKKKIVHSISNMSKPQHVRLKFVPPLKDYVCFSSVRY